MRAFGWLIVSVLAAFTSSAQVAISSISDEVRIPIAPFSLRVHSGIYPEIRQTDTNWVKGRKLNIQPLAELTANQGAKLNYFAGLGVGLEAYTGTNMYHRFSYTSGISTGNEAFGLPETTWKALSANPIRWANDVRWRSAITPNKYLHVAIGIDQQFFGEGYRSLVQSDQVAPAPFALGRVNFKRLEYGLLYQGLHENQTTSRLWKYNALHYLSINITKKWSMMVIESVMIQSKDSTFRRGFDIEYLNPIVFYRPQEYSLGSSDNVLLAAQTAVKIGKQTLYAQLALDDFSLVELRARSKWWATKYAVQIGAKGRLKQNMNYRLEVNVIRPYTYSHLNNSLNNAHSGLPIAHPLGANLAELIAQMYWKQGNNNWKFSLQYYLKGLDFVADTSWGGDVFKSYDTRPLNKEYGNTIGQGVTQRNLMVCAEWNRQIRKSWLNLFVQPQLVFSYGELKSSLQPVILAGCRSTLFQRRKLF